LEAIDNLCPLGSGAETKRTNLPCFCNLCRRLLPASHPHLLRSPSFTAADAAAADAAAPDMNQPVQKNTLYVGTR
jgi:hypothetical protein